MTVESAPSTAPRQGFRIDFHIWGPVVALLALMWWRVPPWLVVVGCALVAGLPGADAWAAFA